MPKGHKGDDLPRPMAQGRPCPDLTAVLLFAAGIATVLDDVFALAVPAAVGDGFSNHP